MKIKKSFFAAGGFLAAFVLWTVLVSTVDREAIGPNGSTVGFSTVNGWIHALTGVNMTLYTITDWLGLVPIGIALGFAVLGLCQWIRRKNLAKVDRSILALGGFYAAVAASFVLFEYAVVNYRPVLIEGRLEASYPSSTTLLVMCVLPTAILQARARISHKTWRMVVTALASVFLVFMVVGRILSGVHWISDILGGALLSTGLVLLYCAFATKE